MAGRIASAVLLLVLLAPVLWLLGSAVVSESAGGAPVLDRAAGRAYSSTLVIASVAGGVSVVVGLVYGWFMSRVRRAAAMLMMAASLLPLLLAPYAVALAWMLLASPQQHLGAGPAAGLRSLVTPEAVASPAGAGLILASLLWPVAAWLTCLAVWSQPRELEDAARLETTHPAAAWFSSRHAVLAALAASATVIFLLAAAEYSVPNCLSVHCYPRELVLRFQADYSLKGAVLLSLPALIAAVPLVALSSALLEASPQPSGADRARASIHSAWFTAAGLLTAVATLTAAVGAPVLTLARYAGRSARPGQILAETLEVLMPSLVLGAIAAALTVAAALTFRHYWGNAAPRSRLPRTNLWGAADLLLTLPYALPASLTAVAAIALSTADVVPTYLSPLLPLVWVYVVVFLPFPLRVLALAWRRVSLEALDNAAVDGAGAGAAFRHAVWPAVGPYAILAGAIVFILAGREMDATSLMRTPGLTTAAFRIHDYLHFYPVPDVAALCLGLTGAQWLALLAAGAFFAALLRRE